MRDFSDVFKKALREFDITFDEVAFERFCRYDELLIEWNEKMNLTALTEPRDVAVKHFIDSLMLLKYADIPQGVSMIDVGTGAGFPGLAIKIARPDIRLTLLDSLQKRLSFLDEVYEQLGLEDVVTVHGRAEEGAREILFRENYDVAVARAVASLNVLAEYCLPYVGVGGRFIAMKGKSAEEELNEAKNAIGELGGRVGEKHLFSLGDAGERGIIVIDKVAPTPEKYPRKSKQIKKKPL